MKSVSLIVPVYQAGAFLTPLIRSAQNQDYSDFQLVLSDDGSTDDSMQVMERMAREVPQLHPRLIPYKTASTEQGMLLALRPEWMQVDGKEEKMLVAFSPVTVSDGGGYQALLGGVR